MKRLNKEAKFMSAFLGKIHYWLFNKIQLHEILINNIAEFAKGNGFDTEGVLEQSYKKFGYPVSGSLENEIEHTNIHGWLQERIISVEKRLAYVVTEALKVKAVSVDQVAGIFTQNAVQTFKESGASKGKPQDYFTMIFDYMLEGMPCDRVNEIIENTETIISWKTTRCLHKSYWEEVGGDINNFYLFRDAWINGFLSLSNSGLIYNRAADAISTIKRV
jgi:hypothetical protein